MSETPIILKHVEDSRLSCWDAAPFLKRVTEVVPNIIYIFNQQTQSNEYSNRSLGEALGYSTQEVLDMGASLMPRLCHPQDLTQVTGHFAVLSSLQDGQVAQLEYRLRHKAGHWVWLLSHDTVFERDASGQVLRHIGVASDITALKDAQAHALAEKRKATTTNDELLAFAYAMSHDMKAPSNTLHMLLRELIESHGQTLDPDAAELCQMALTTVARMGKLVDDVQNYTRVVDQDFNRQAVPLTPVITAVLDDLAGLVAKTKAVVRCEDLPTVSGDPDQLHILFLNLIENALHFHKPNEPAKVFVTSHPSPDKAGFAITIRDEGIGIEPAKHQQIFRVFKRLNTAAEFPGSGLGLAICRRIAANHDSQIDLSSALGQGAAFTIGLPSA